MKLLEARSKLKELACGEYQSMIYEVTDTFTGAVVIECKVYINEQSHHSGETWDEALQKMEYAIYPDRKPTTEIEDI